MSSQKYLITNDLQLVAPCCWLLHNGEYHRAYWCRRSIIFFRFFLVLPRFFSENAWNASRKRCRPVFRSDERIISWHSGSWASWPWWISARFSSTKSAPRTSTRPRGRRFARLFRSSRAELKTSWNTEERSCSFFPYSWVPHAQEWCDRIKNVFRIEKQAYVTYVTYVKRGFHLGSLR